MHGSTRLTALFEMRVPILAGGLMWLSDAVYVSALARAGCMAFITPRSFDSLAAFEAPLLTCRDACGEAPFGVNLTLSRRFDFEADVVAQLDLTLGCEGVLIGRRFLTGAEVPVHPAVRQRLLAAGAEDSVMRLRGTGPHRGMGSAA